MRVKVLYPIAVSRIHVTKEVDAGAVIELAAEIAASLIADGAVEAVDAKAQVEQATAAPGEKRRVGRPRKIRS